MQTRHAKPRSRADLAGCSHRPQHPLWRQRQRAVSKTNRKMHIVPEDDAPTARGHSPARERMKGVVDRLFARQNPGAMSLSRPARVRRTWPSPSREAASDRDRAGASLPPSISATGSKPKHAPDARGTSLIISRAWTSSSSTNSAICPSLRPAGSSVPSRQPAQRANVDRRHHQSRLRRMAERVRRSEDDDRASRPPHPSLRHRRDRQRKLALQEPRLILQTTAPR